jgi:hypothetical protein
VDVDHLLGDGVNPVYRVHQLRFRLGVLMQAYANAQCYAWSDWLIGIMRSFLSGGAAAFITLGGGALVGVPSNKLWIMIGINFVTMGLYRMGEFLQLHGAPEKVTTTTVESTNIQPVGAGVQATVKTTQTVSTDAPKP